MHHLSISTEHTHHSMSGSFGHETGSMVLASTLGDLFCTCSSFRGTHLVEGHNLHQDVHLHSQTEIQSQMIAAGVLCKA